MPLPLHTLNVVDAASGQAGNGLVDPAVMVVAKLSSVPNVVGGGAGLTVVTAVTFANELPADYAVLVTPNQDAVPFVSGKTSTGFNVTLSPRLATNTLAVGTFDVLVVA